MAHTKYMSSRRIILTPLLRHHLRTMKFIRVSDLMILRTFTESGSRHCSRGPFENVSLPRKGPPAHTHTHTPCLLTPRPHPRPQVPAPRCLCLFWAFHVSGIVQRVVCSSGMTFPGLACLATSMGTSSPVLSSPAPGWPGTLSPPSRPWTAALFARWLLGKALL